MIVKGISQFCTGVAIRCFVFYVNQSKERFDLVTRNACFDGTVTKSKFQ